MLFSQGSTATKEERDWYVVLEARLFVDMLYRRYLATFNPSPSITHAYSTGTKTGTKPLGKKALSHPTATCLTLPIYTGDWRKKTNRLVGRRRKDLSHYLLTSKTQPFTTRHFLTLSYNGRRKRAKQTEPSLLPFMRRGSQSNVILFFLPREPVKCHSILSSVNSRPQLPCLTQQTQMKQESQYPQKQQVGQQKQQVDQQLRSESIP